MSSHRHVGLLLLLIGLMSCAGQLPRPDAGAASAGRSDEIMAVRTGRLLDVRSGRVVEGAIVLVRAGLVTAVGRDVRIPAGARIVDATALTVLPGLIDAHVHLTLQGRPRDNARKTLEAGFTTAADLGSAAGGGVRLRRLIEADSAAGPRIVAAGSWIGGRGGVCEFGGATIRGEADARARAEADVTAGADLLKVCVTDWLDPVVQYPDSVELTSGELAAVAAVGRAAKRPLVAHAIGRAGVTASLAAGIRLFAHTPVVDARGAEALARAGACVATTMTTLGQGKFAAELRASFQRLRAARVKLMLGTDAGVLSHGTNADELVTLVSLGVSPLEAIGAATWQAADCLGLTGRGVVEVGSPADLIGVKGDPLVDIAVLKAPALVVKGGVAILPVTTSSPRRE